MTKSSEVELVFAGSVVTLRVVKCAARPRVEMRAQNNVCDRGRHYYPWGDAIDCEECNGTGVVLQAG